MSEAHIRSRTESAQAASADQVATTVRLVRPAQQARPRGARDAARVLQQRDHANRDELQCVDQHS